MTRSELSIPKWILIVSGFFALLEILVSFFIWFSPQSVLETVDLKAEGVDYLMKVWATRQFALGFVFAFATIKQSISMLLSSFIFLLVMFLGDLLIGIAQQESALILTAIIMSIISLGMLYKINKFKKNNKDNVLFN